MACGKYRVSKYRNLGHSQLEEITANKNFGACRRFCRAPSKALGKRRLSFLTYASEGYCYINRQWLVLGDGVCLRWQTGTGRRKVGDGGRRSISFHDPQKATNSSVPGSNHHQSINLKTSNELCPAVSIAELSGRQGSLSRSNEDRTAQEAHYTGPQAYQTRLPLRWRHYPDPPESESISHLNVGPTPCMPVDRGLQQITRGPGPVAACQYMYITRHRAPAEMYCLYCL